jgi:hypothetical protein
MHIERCVFVVPMFGFQLVARMFYDVTKRQKQAPISSMKNQLWPAVRKKFFVLVMAAGRTTIPVKTKSPAGFGQGA